MPLGEEGSGSLGQVGGLADREDDVMCGQRGRRRGQGRGRHCSEGSRQGIQAGCAWLGGDRSAGQSQQGRFGATVTLTQGPWIGGAVICTLEGTGSEVIRVSVPGRVRRGIGLQPVRGRLTGSPGPDAAEPCGRGGGVVVVMMEEEEEG